MSKKASAQDVGEVHNLLTGLFIQQLNVALAGGEVPTALISAAVKFVKDNNITADPETNERFKELAGLMAKLNGNPDDAEAEDGKERIAFV